MQTENYWPLRHRYNQGREDYYLNQKLLVFMSSLQLISGRYISKLKTNGHYVIATTLSGKIAI